MMVAQKLKTQGNLLKTALFAVAFNAAVFYGPKVNAENLPDYTMNSIAKPKTEAAVPKKNVARLDDTTFLVGKYDDTAKYVLKNEDGKLIYKEVKNPDNEARDIGKELLDMLLVACIGFGPLIVIGAFLEMERRKKEKDRN